jgi:hypothetical protein
MLDLAAENVAVAKSSVSGAASFLRLQVSKARSLVACALRRVIVVLCALEDRPPFTERQLSGGS